MSEPALAWPYPDWLLAHQLEPSYSWAFKAWDRAAANDNAWFDHAKAAKVVELWPTWFALTEDRFAGVPFKLLPWQAIIVRLLVGWKVPTEVLDPLTHKATVAQVRLHKRLLLWIPRKNGKSEFLSALGLLFFAIEGVSRGQGFCFARDEKQARIVLNKMKAMIAENPRLAADSQSHTKSIYLKPTASVFEMLTGSLEGKHGLSPTVSVGDEIHEWRSRTIENTLRQGMGARLQPIELFASTAGLRTSAVGLEVWNETLAILDGSLDDPSTLAVVFAAPADADFRDEAAWRAANPSLGLSVGLDFMRREARLAEGSPRAEAHFRCYHLNQWVDGAVRWLSLKKWDACAASKTAWASYAETLRGRLCFGAFDVSSTQDITALVWLFPPSGDDDQWRLICRFWVPEDTFAARAEANQGQQWDLWRKSGAIETTPGSAVDQEYVAQALTEGLEAYDVQVIGFDPWNARKLVADLEKAGVDIETFVEMRQGIQSLGEASKHFERLVTEGRLDHGGHPILRWMAANAVVRFDENLNFMPAKKRSAEKIDGIMAAVMATGAATCNAEEGAGLDSYLRNLAAHA